MKTTSAIIINKVSTGDGFIYLVHRKHDSTLINAVANEKWYTYKTVDGAEKKAASMANDPDIRIERDY